MSINIKELNKLPDSPGVYFFLGKNKEILYIGKATSLRDRVRSYFASDLLKTRTQLIHNMVQSAATLDYRTTDSVLEALLLEADLIKKFQPPANTDEKDDKSSNCIVITNEDFPQVLTIRQKDLYMKYDEKELKYVFGPYPNGGQLREALKIVRHIFPFRDAKCVPAEDQIKAGKTPRPCFNRQIGLCPGVCTGEVSKKEYAKTVQNLNLFFQGKKKDLIKNLEKQMKEYAKEREFEKASYIRERIYSINHIQDVSLIKKDRKTVRDVQENECFRIEAYDIAHMGGKDTTGVMVVIEDGELSKNEYRKFKIKENKGVNDIASLKEVLRRRFNHPEWPWPNLIVLDGSTAQMNAAEEIVTKSKEAYQGEMPDIALTAVVKNAAHKPERIIGDETLVAEHEREILLANGEAHRFVIAYHKKLRNRSFLG